MSVQSQIYASLNFDEIKEQYNYWGPIESK
jgi:hypothetical protein